METMTRPSILILTLLGLLISLSKNSRAVVDATSSHPAGATFIVVRRPHCFSASGRTTSIPFSASASTVQGLSLRNTFGRSQQRSGRERLLRTERYSTIKSSSSSSSGSGSISDSPVISSITTPVNNVIVSTNSNVFSFGVDGDDNERGDIHRIDLNSNEDDGFLTANAVPTFAFLPDPDTKSGTKGQTMNNNDEAGNMNMADTSINVRQEGIKRLGLEGVIPGAFILRNVLQKAKCEDIIRCCEDTLKFQQYSVGKNNHGAMQVVVPESAATCLGSMICPFIDLDVINELANDDNLSMNRKNAGDGSGAGDEYAPIGLNRRWRIYKYQPGGEETFAPHIDAGFPPSALSDRMNLIWDATSAVDNNDNNENAIDSRYPEDTVSRLTVLIYLNDDFLGGQTKFYTPLMDENDQCDSSPTDISSSSVIASVKPQAGSVLLFPQAVGEDAVDYARKYWPLHEGSPVTSTSTSKDGKNRAKYVIRSDVLFTKVRQSITEEEQNDPLWKNDDFVRQTFKPSASPSSTFNPLFLKHCQELYNPAMGVENAGPLLYSLVRFTKIRNIVEIGAGYTTLWILQALKDNDIEMKKIKSLQDDGKCRLLDIAWSITDFVDAYNDIGDSIEGIQEAKSVTSSSSSLLCIDNCLHQRETASGAGAVAKALGLDNYLQFVKGDAFDMQFEEESIDLLWCDFGVGSKMKHFATGAWKSIRPGGFLICHSALTNSRTRSWLEKIRSGCALEEETGIPPGEFVELSLLEPHKRYQNSITILQRRKGSMEHFKEPIFSEFA